METGIKGYSEIFVDDDVSAANMGSGLLNVFATPSMICLMERACSDSVLPALGGGFATVGTRVEVSHIKASPMGARVWAESELVKIEGDELLFEVKAFDERGMIGCGVHTRHIVDIERFYKKIIL